MKYFLHNKDNTINVYLTKNPFLASLLRFSCVGYKEMFYEEYKITGAVVKKVGKKIKILWYRGEKV